MRYAGTMPIRNDAVVIDQCKQQIADALPLAVSTMIEIMTLGEKESVRLAAAEALMERGGLPKKQVHEVRVDQSEHERVTLEVQRTMADLERNQAAISAPTPSLDAVMVLEGDEQGEEDILDAHVV